MKVYLTATLQSKPGQAEALKVLLNELVNASTQEAACIQYELFQDTANENLFFFHETWQDGAGIALHNTQPHLQVFGQQAAHILDGPVKVYTTQKLR